MPDSARLLLETQACYWKLSASLTCPIACSLRTVRPLLYGA